MSSAHHVMWFALCDFAGVRSVLSTGMQKGSLNHSDEFHKAHMIARKSSQWSDACASLDLNY